STGLRRIGGSADGRSQTVFGPDPSNPANSIPLRGTGVGVAVLDTGIAVNHPDLVVVSGKNTIGGKSYDDDNGHGTAVASAIAARDNGIGAVGVAPEAGLYAVKVIDKNEHFTTASVISGIKWVTQNAKKVKPQIKVANMSFGLAVDGLTKRDNDN